MDTKQYVRERLFAMQDAEYRDFQRKLMPTVAPESVIGVRTPELRQFAKEFGKTPEAAEFMNSLPHEYYEENNLHGFLIEQIKDFDAIISELDKFLMYVDNWATCDMMRPRIFKKRPPELIAAVRRWLDAGDTYTVRFGIGVLMNHYLDDGFGPEYPEWVAAVKSEEYYIKMMVAWYFATALAKQWDAVLPYITERRFEPWTHNKAIQKAIESRRITARQKEFLRKYKVL